ncbi:MAG: hypothetical protein HOB68_11040 [Candidatus Marinimicrobia bacterium]|jgi:ribosomal protein S1|nr:hypothetical protein [Candidatus Neomarinimicrobiota bacterium]MBT3960496.1 hypothetical protein [Candidatus Neomarinimicrobiota bacterium]MBT4686385.1 hypothetical protein [Candidatus Neomarinimicrobiota bacterium]MBT7900334.1 hypothetical protein [Candidatus Neomarinimicrobiota bacterium]
MSKHNQKYKIINNEGAICNVNTADKSGNFYGKHWTDICESILHGKAIEGVIDRSQYKSPNGDGEKGNRKGSIVKIGSKIEAFLPVSLYSKYRNLEEEQTGERIAFMVQDFDPLSNSIIVKELKVVDVDFDIKAVNQSLSLIGKAQMDKKFISGTIVGESKNKNGNRAGFIVSVSGIEAFLPMSKSYLTQNVEIGQLIGHNVLCTVEEINVERMSVILSSLGAYEKLLGKNPRPSLNIKTTGLVGWVAPYNVYVLLPQNILGLVPKNHYQDRTHGDWLNLTGEMIECVPIKIKKWNERFQDFQVHLSLA